MGTSKMPVSRAKTAYELLSEIRRLILAEPKRYDQTTWLIKKRGTLAWRYDDFPACGTIGCVAGWVVALKNKRSKETIMDAAGRILGLSYNQEDMLFSGNAAKGEPQTQQHAQSGAKHIARFMKKYATQLKATRV